MNCFLKFYRIGKVFWSSVYSEETLSLTPGKFFKRFSNSTCYCQSSIVLNWLKFFVKRRLGALAMKNISIVDIISRINVLQIVRNDDLGRTGWNLRSNPIDLLTLDEICFICSLKVNFESKTNTKCFWAV